MFQYSKALANAALGKEKADTVLKNAKIVSVFTNEIREADVAITDGMIVGIGEYEGKEELDMHGKYVCPGFIDAHLHLESTLLNPKELVHQASLKGTTTFVVDPHEAANVSGKDGIDFILNETKDVEADVYVMVPSCVPSGKDEDNGFTLDARDIASYKLNSRVLGLGEVMDSTAVMDVEEKMLEKLFLFHDKVIDGHAGYLGDKETNCYTLSGIKTDHECTTFEDALRELRAGMYVLIREGTAAKNLEHILKGVIEKKLPYHQLAFCTDDKHIEDIQREGHISYNIRKAIELGVDPIEAVKMATLYPATCYGLKQSGAVAPGYYADLVVLSELEAVNVEQVYYRGRLVESEKKIVNDEVPEELLSTVHIKLGGIEDFSMPLSDETAVVINMVPEEILTEYQTEKVRVENGLFVPDENRQKVIVFERHNETGKRGYGILKGFHFTGGAIASTVGHDSHNLIVVGDNDESMHRAVLELMRCQGGYTIVENGKEPLTLELEVMGLLSRKPYQEVKARLKTMIDKAYEMGVPKQIDPFITLSFLSLPVLPEVRITTRGVYDVKNQTFINLNGTEKGGLYEANHF